MNHCFTKQMKDKHYFKNLYFSTLKKCQYMHIKIYGSQYIYKSCCAAYLWPMQLHIWKLFFFNVHVFSLLFSNTSDPTSILPAHLVIKLELLMTFLLLFTLFKKPSSALLFLGPHVWRCWFRPLFETNRVFWVVRMHLMQRISHHVQHVRKDSLLTLSHPSSSTSIQSSAWSHRSRKSVKAYDAYLSHFGVWCDRQNNLIHYWPFCLKSEK